MRLHGIVVILLGLLYTKCACQTQASELSAFSIPFYFNINNDLGYYNKGSVVTVTAANDRVIYDSKNLKPFKWGGEQPGAQLSLHGPYTIHVKFYEDSTSTATEFSEDFTVEGDELKVELDVNIERFKQVDNSVYLIKYFGNKYNAQLKRLWDPMLQLKAQKQLMPRYDLINNADSDIFGIEYGTSSWMTIMWVARSRFENLQIQVFAANNWYAYPICSNVLQLAAPLKAGATGKMILNKPPGCPCKMFAKGAKYRALVEYTINNDVNRVGKLPGGNDEFNYHELNVYQVADEFTVSP